MELKPCPFCGSEARIVKSVLDRYWAECSDQFCGCALYFEDTKEEAITAWNTRHD